MRPLFTVHAGEFLVGQHIERSYPNLKVWIPSKDIGVDLLITDLDRRSVSLQVKLSIDHVPLEAKDEFDRLLIAGGWLNLVHKKIENSPADWWVIVLVSHERIMKPQFIVIPPSELLSCLVKTLDKPSEKYNFYPQIMKRDSKPDLCLDGRGLSKKERENITKDFQLGTRDLSKYLNNWSCLEALRKS